MKKMKKMINLENAKKNNKSNNEKILEENIMIEHNFRGRTKVEKMELLYMIFQYDLLLNPLINK